jgi:hypothetical protein
MFSRIGRTSGLLIALLCLSAPTAQAAEPVAVTVETFVRAESDLYFNGVVKQVGVGRFHHIRTPMEIGHQTVIRGNRDTLYSSAVFDLDGGPVTITMPDAGRRFMSLQLISQDHYTTTLYGAGDHVVDKERFGSRYVMVGIRTLVDPEKPEDVQAAHALQDGVKATQPKGPGRFDIPAWEPGSQKKIRDALLVLAASITDTRRAFGSRQQVDPIQHLIGAASAWGANPPADAIYLNVVPNRNDGVAVYRLTAKDVPVDGFWSVSVYDEKGYYQPNALNAYTFNNLTAKPGPDGAITVQFGGCDGKVDNCLPTVPGWNYMVRLYRPRAEIMGGSWQFPAAMPLN